MPAVISTNWVLYDHPKDFPKHWVARRWVQLEGESALRPCDPAFLFRKFQDACDWLDDYGFVHTTPMPGEDPAIAGVWI